MHAHRADGTVAIFSLTGSENWIDITKTQSSVQTHWMAESGVLDLIVFLGPMNEEIFEQYGQLTGTTALPQMFAIGHHQCRWNYLTQEDVLEVSANFDKYDMPMDVIWLDIEYATEVNPGLLADGGEALADTHALHASNSTNTSCGTRTPLVSLK